MYANTPIIINYNIQFTVVVDGSQLGIFVDVLGFGRFSDTTRLTLVEIIELILVGVKTSSDGCSSQSSPKLVSNCNLPDVSMGINKKWMVSARFSTTFPRVPNCCVANTMGRFFMQMLLRRPWT